MRRFRLAWAIATMSVVVMASTGSASAATTVGSNLSGDTFVGFGCPSMTACTWLQSELDASEQAPGGLASPVDGVVVRWRIKAGPSVSPVSLRVLRPADGTTWTGAGTSATVTPAANAISTFDTRLPIRTGDHIAIDCCAGLSHYWAPPASAATKGSRWDPRLADQESRAADPTGWLGELLLNADIEPDADADGFGDETQDQCPTNPTTQGPCPVARDTDPPETTITKDVKRSEIGKVKFRFVSDEAGATFECKVKGPDLKRKLRRFRECVSPQKYRNLDEGRFKFKVRAVDAAGNVDSTPDKDRFRVVD